VAFLSILPEILILILGVILLIIEPFFKRGTPPQSWLVNCGRIAGYFGHHYFGGSSWRCDDDFRKYDSL